MRGDYYRENMSESDKRASEFVQQTQSYLIRNVQSIIESYTKDEISILQREFWGVSVNDVLHNIGLPYLRRIYILSKSKAENLPLHINDEERFVRGYVFWRLKVGK